MPLQDTDPTPSFGGFGFRLALPEAAKNLGIVYTPTEVVDYIVHSVEKILQHEFDTSLGQEGVHILDPFAGTGSFITRLLQSGLISLHDLSRKYTNEIHANEMYLLAYYIAAINIESTYHELAQCAKYESFNGMVLADTFQSYELRTPMDEALFPTNSDRAERQKALDIRVIMGNPPWSATNNHPYSNLDDRIGQSYRSSRKKNALRDPYVRAIRLASDKVLQCDEGGVVAFVTNGGFIESNSFDGFRKAVAEEFDVIYCYNLRGDQRTAGEKSKREGGKIFGSNSRAGVAILILVKRPGISSGQRIHYCDIGDYHTRDDKLEILALSSFADTKWVSITPNDHQDWIGQRSEAFSTFRPMARSGREADTRSLAPIFSRQTLGLVTSRDAWCYNSSTTTLLANIERSVDFYNSQVASFHKTSRTGTLSQRERQAKSFASIQPRQFHWSRENYRDMAKGTSYTVSEDDVRVSHYRPFFKQHLYFNRRLNNSIRDFLPFILLPMRTTSALQCCVKGPVNRSTC